jgi:hypothetical protein
MKEMEQDTKFMLQFLMAFLVHPLAAILIWVNLAARSDIGPRLKAFWVFMSFIWLFGPLAYIAIGGGRFW